MKAGTHRSMKKDVMQCFPCRARRAFIMLLAGVSMRAFAGVNAADAIYTGGDILTMAGDKPAYVQALAIKGGRILFAGNKADALKLVDTRTRLVNLQGKTLLPGFVDGHSHITGVGTQSISANLLPPPDGPVSSIPQLHRPRVGTQ